MPRALFATLVTVGLTACTPVGPNYDVPTIDIAGRFAHSPGQSAGERIDQAWWQNFHDPILNKLVLRGFSQNLNIQSAMAAAEAARARASATGVSALQQPVTAGVVAERAELDAGPVNRTTSATLNVSYVFDVFGRVQRTQEAAIAEVESAEFQVGTARLAYLSAIIGSYIDARYAQELLELTRQAIESQRRVYVIVLEQQEEGEASDLQVAQARASLDTQIAQLPMLESNFKSSVYSIATLLNEPALPLLVALERSAPQPVPRGVTDIGVPADLLINRPDIKVAERNFAASVAKVGIAEAELYPSIALRGNISVNSDASNLSLGPALSIPVLNKNTLGANRDAAAALARQSQIQWRESVIEAIGEVQSAQSAYESSNREAQSLRSALASNQRARDLTQSSYMLGESTVPEFIDATQSVTETRRGLAAAMHRTASSWLNLQIASGAGWAVKSEPKANQTVAAAD